MVGLARCGACALISLVAVSARAQQAEVPEGKAAQEGKREEKTFDLSFAHDPRELHEEADKASRWKHIWGPLGIGDFHVFPAREGGPYLSPPIRVWGAGFGTSLWRDPVTGWALQ